MREKSMMILMFHYDYDAIYKNIKKARENSKYLKKR